MSQPRNEELEAFKDALWDFFLEHCDVERSGAYFIKFHASGRANIEKRIMARHKYNYHREDPRMKETIGVLTAEAHMRNKRKKHEVWKANKDERRRIFETLNQSKNGSIEPTKDIHMPSPWYRNLLQKCGIIQ